MATKAISVLTYEVRYEKPYAYQVRNILFIFIMLFIAAVIVLNNVSPTVFIVEVLKPYLKGCIGTMVFGLYLYTPKTKRLYSEDNFMDYITNKVNDGYDVKYNINYKPY